MGNPEKFKIKTEASEQRSAVERGGRGDRSDTSPLSTSISSADSWAVFNDDLKVVTSEKVGRSGVTSTPGTLFEGVVMGVLLSFNEAAILYGAFNIAPP
jgi:hypothetical protein